MARADISYDFEDFGMTGAQLQDKYGREHPEYTNLDYNAAMKDVSEEKAIPAYWTWVKQQIAKDDDAIPSNGVTGQPVPDPAPSDIKAMSNIDEFAAHLVAWNNRKVAILEHMMDVPEGTEVIININGDEKSVKLEGDIRVAFRGGLATALAELGTLPFVAMPVEAAPSQQADTGPAKGG